MKILKGTILKVRSRRGVNLVKVNKDFDTEKDEWWDCLLESDVANGLTRDWFKGEQFTLRRGLATILSIEKEPTDETSST